MHRVALLLAVVGCKYTPPDAGGVPNDGPTDVMIVPDVLPDPALCTDTTTSMCLGNVLRHCEVMGQLPEATTCAICEASPAPHCETLVPSSNGATAEDLAPDGMIVDITIVDDVRADTNSGEITGVRPGGEGVLNGIGFRIVNNIAIWKFHSLTINNDFQLIGGNAAVLAANRSIDVNDQLDVRGDCQFQTAGPGGSSGGIAEQDGSGGGKGLKGNGVTNNASGGSGGGHGAAGSGGAASAAQPATTGGIANGDLTITMLRGGSGGGGGGGETTTGGVGGGGGGALQLVANDRITFGTNGGINAGGCGGQRGAFGTAGGAGGGAGGTILLEAIAVNLTTGILAVNGGGGGAGNNSFSGVGSRGQLSRTAAGGGTGNGTSGGNGGNGSAPATPSGTAGSSGTSNQNGGGGGGAVGRMRINTRNDQGLTGTCAPCSPNFGDSNTTLTRGPVQILSAAPP